MKYLFITRIYDDTYATYHDNFESLQREKALLEKETGVKIQLLDPAALHNECCLSDYKIGTGFAIEMTKHYSDVINKEEQKKYFSPFSGQWQ